MMNKAKVGPWQPEKNRELQVGPPRWNGTTVVVDASTGKDPRILQMGLREQLVLARIDGQQSPTAIAKNLTDCGVPITEQQVWETLNRLAFFNLISRPYLDDLEEIEDIDNQRHEEPGTLAEVYIPRIMRRLSLWSHFSWLGSSTIAAVVLVFAVAGAIGIALRFPQAIDTILGGKASVIGLVACIAIAIVWSLGVLLLHELAHSGAFYGRSGRTPYLAIVRFGFLFSPTSQLPGLNLLPKAHKGQIVLLGPATSLACALIPVSLVSLADPDSVLGTYGAVSLLIETIVIARGLTPTPNTDMARYLETLCGVESLHLTSWRSITGKYPVPAALPVETKLAIFGYPILLLLSLIAWAAAATWVIRLALN